MKTREELVAEIEFLESLLCEEMTKRHHAEISFAVQNERRERLEKEIADAQDIMTRIH